MSLDCVCLQYPMNADEPAFKEVACRRDHFAKP